MFSMIEEISGIDIPNLDESLFPLVINFTKSEERKNNYY